MKQIAGKWNYKTRKYDKYNPKWDLMLVTGLGASVNCSACGKKTIFGMCYTSKEIHNDIGLGYPVCDKCYDIEIMREREHESKNDL